MNQSDTPSATATPASESGSIPGAARVESLPGGAASRSGIASGTLLGEWVGSLLGLVARVLSPGLVGLILSNARRGGHLLVLAGAALTVVYAIFGAIKYNSFAIFAIGLGLVAALAIAQFAAIRFLDAADRLVASTPSRVSSTAFLECVGLLVLLFALTTVLGGIAGAIETQSFAPLLPAVILGVILTCFGALALHPQTVNVDVGAGSAGEEAIGLLSFLFKANLKLVPLFFFLLAAAGSLTVVLSFGGAGGAVGRTVQGIVNSVPIPVQMPYGLSGSALILIGCLAPIFGYFVFLLQYLFVDVLRAILSVPSKLDAIKR